MRFVQLLLTDEQAELTAAALRDAEKALKELAEEDVPEEHRSYVGENIAQIGRLSMLFQDMSENPAKYTPTGEMARTVRSIVKRAKGRPQIPSLRKKRADRHQRRRMERRYFRRNREYIEQYNRAVEITEAERAEAEANAAELAKRIEGQPTYTVTDGYGNVLMSGIPAEFVLDADGKSLAAPKIEVAR